MAADAKKQKPFWKSLFSKEEAMEEARAYDELSFFKKSKNVLITFMLVVSALSIGLSAFGNVENLTLEGVIIDVVIYLILLPFVYFNHRWAMVLTCLLYGAGKIVLMVQGLGTPISHIIFLMIVVSLTYKSLIVASVLKKKRLEVAL